MDPGMLHRLAPLPNPGTVAALRGGRLAVLGSVVQPMAGVLPESQSSSA